MERITIDQIRELLKVLNDANGISENAENYTKGALHLSIEINGLQLIRIHSTSGRQSRVNPIGSLTRREMYLYLYGMVEMLKY